jgi:hypothetical protein
MQGANTLARGPGRESPGRAPTSEPLARIQSAQGWSMGVQGEKRSLHPVSMKLSWGFQGSRNAPLNGAATARRCDGAAPARCRESAISRGDPTGARSGPPWQDWCCSTTHILRCVLNGVAKPQNSTGWRWRLGPLRRCNIGLRPVRKRPPSPLAPSVARKGSNRATGALRPAMGHARRCSLKECGTVAVRQIRVG